jgi:hypothetical protein
MRRTFGFDVLTCPRCGGRLGLVAVIEDTAIIGRILRHLGLPDEIPLPRPVRAPPRPWRPTSTIGPAISPSRDHAPTRTGTYTPEVCRRRPCQGHRLCRAPPGVILARQPRESPISSPALICAVSVPMRREGLIRPLMSPRHPANPSNRSRGAGGGHCASPRRFDVWRPFLHLPNQRRTPAPSCDRCPR